jgi:hypothetical protein
MAEAVSDPPHLEEVADYINTEVEPLVSRINVIVRALPPSVPNLALILAALAHCMAGALVQGEKHGVNGLEEFCATQLERSLKAYREKNR